VGCRERECNGVGRMVAGRGVSRVGEMILIFMRMLKGRGRERQKWVLVRNKVC